MTPNSVSEHQETLSAELTGTLHYKNQYRGMDLI